jgi:hypothetical protein
MSGWTPKLYYDFLARIIPGSLVVLGALYLQEGPARSVNYFLRSICDLEQSLLCRLGIGLLVAYLTGMVIGEVGELLWGRVLRRRDAEMEMGFERDCIDEHNRALSAAGLPPLELLQDDLPDVETMAEQLAVADHYAGARLLALVAERRLCMVVAFGFFILAVGNLLVFTGDLVLKRLTVEALFVLGLLVFWRRATRLHEREVRRTTLGWLMSVARSSSSGQAG